MLTFNYSILKNQKKKKKNLSPIQLNHSFSQKNPFFKRDFLI